MALNIKAFFPFSHPLPTSNPLGVELGTVSNEHQKQEREKDDHPHERPAYQIYKEALLGLDPLLAARIRKPNEHTQD
jgi:hypothetical protein